MRERERDGAIDLWEGKGYRDENVGSERVRAKKWSTKGRDNGTSGDWRAHRGAMRDNDKKRH